MAYWIFYLLYVVEKGHLQILDMFKHVKGILFVEKKSVPEEIALNVTVSRGL